MPTSASAFRARFYQVYQELIEAGTSDVDSAGSAARALLIAGGHDPGPATATTSSTGEEERRESSSTDDGSLASDSHSSSSPDVSTAKVPLDPSTGDESSSSSGTTDATTTPPSVGTQLDTIAVPDTAVQEQQPNVTAEAVEEEAASESAVELITPERIRELIEICRSQKEQGFRELIRFLGRTLSNPFCVSASFALPFEGTGGAVRGDGTVRDSGGNIRLTDSDVDCADESLLDDGVHEGAEPRFLHDWIEHPPNAAGLFGLHDDDTPDFTNNSNNSNTSSSSSSATINNVATTTTAAAVEKQEQETQLQQTAAATTTETATDTNTTTTVEDEEKGEANAVGESDSSIYECVDQSKVGMDVEKAAEVWKILRQLGDEGVAGAVANALESLAQTLLLQRIIDRGGGRDGIDDVDGADNGNTAGRACVRAIILILEHPEIQDPDLERVLITLFGLAERLKRRHKEVLRRFFAGLEEEDFRRYLGAVQQFVALKLYSGGDSSSVLSAVVFIHLLYTANQASRLIEDKAFYNEAINSELFSHQSTLNEEYNTWRQDQQVLALDGNQLPEEHIKSLISYGEVLDPASKAAVLRLDSQVQMRGMIHNQVHEAMMSGGLLEGSVTVMPYLVLRVRRSNIVQDSLHALVMCADEDLKKPLRVQFVGEEGVDEGGVQKEYFQVMLRELLDPKYSMFKYDEETRRLWFNSDSLEAQEEFELVGMLVGIAIYNGIILDIRLPLVVYKLVLGAQPTLQDLKEAQPSLGRGLQQLLDFEGDVEGTFDRTFQISYEVFGAVKTFDLKDGGGEVAVTKANRHEYVELYVKWVLVESVKGQYGPFERGFHKVVGGKALSLFRPEELELLICGNPQLDFDALEENSKYEDGYTRDDPVVKRFWEVVREFGEESKRKLLKFATGSDRVPIEGLGSGGLSLVISKNGDDSDRLPTAHTCFNHLLLPSYATKEKLKDRLTLAIEQSEGFGLR